jgi:hypothetical protein
MSISNLNSNITFNEEALALRQIFNSLEENKRNNKEMNNNDKLLKKYNIKINSDFVNLMHNIKNNNKNRYKFKLQKTFCKKNI